MRIYLCGPMNSRQDHNMGDFDRVQEVLERMHHSVVSPIQIDRALGVPLIGPPRMTLPSWYSIELSLKIDFAVIETVDLLVLLEGWERSRACNLEVAYAERLNIPHETFRSLIDRYAILKSNGKGTNAHIKNYRDIVAGL